MCGRYALALRPSHVRAMLEDENLPVDDAPEDEGDHAPRQSYNFAPGYHGIVYRADVPDWGAGPARDRGHTSGGKASTTHDKRADEVEVEEGETFLAQEDEAAGQEPSSTQKIGSKPLKAPNKYKLQSMKWGLIPFWTKRNPDYGAMLKTINCRDDSLATAGGMWSTMKARKRCIVVAQGFYEWLKPPGSKDKIPHFVKRKDGELMLLAGLWDCVVYDNDKAGGEQNGGHVGIQEKNYTYTIITTDSNKQLKFLHDRMPVILDPHSQDVLIWLDPGRHEWSKELQGLLKPFTGELEVYPVTKEVGKVGNDSPMFIMPIDRPGNKYNIANYFSTGDKKHQKNVDDKKGEVEVKKEVKLEPGEEDKTIKTEITSVEELQSKADDGGMFTSPPPKKGVKRERKASPETSPVVAIKDEEGVTPKKRKVASVAPVITSPTPIKGQRPTISATKNPQKKSPVKNRPSKADGSQKITKFFGNSA